jgi:hypothetical protein
MKADCASVPDVCGPFDKAERPTRAGQVGPSGSSYLAVALPRCLLLLGALGCCSPGFAAQSEAVIDLSGQWSVRLDPQDVGETEHWYQEVAGTAIQLPGIATEVELGEALELEPALTKEVLQHLHQRFRYIGAAWYTKRIVLPSDWEGQDATLLLERSIWKTTVWVNGQEAGSEDSLSTAHRHSVGRFLRPGENSIAIRVDNRAQVNIGTMGHAYTDQTQTIWNGVIGRMELRREAAVRISRIRLAPQPAGDVLPLKIDIENRSGESRSGSLVVQAIAENHDAPALPVLERNVTIGERGEEIEFTYPLPGVVTWSEFNPALYRLVCRFDSSEKSIVTGFRTVETIGRQLQINGRPSFMRGTLECCIFPKTGYPAMEVAGWNKIFRTARDFGLNHLRFHSWCPPEAAFAAADRHGIYLQVELPNWTFNMGQRPEVDDFLTKEGERIITEYAHHPSFVFFSLGNELTGDYAFLDRMIEHFRSLAPHLLYTSTTYSFSQRGALPGPADDFFVSQKTQTGWVRGQGFLNQTPPNTTSDYLQGLECLEIPLITHEVGQYNVYPNLTELPKYDGNLRALNFEAIRLDLEQKGRLNDANDYTLNSGKLAALLYKEDIERALRTPGLSGIQLLDLHDFPGQSTATVGLLDAFWDSKGIVKPEEFRRHCGAVVPLLRMPKRTWSGGETFTAQIEMANFGETPLDHCSVQWKIEDEAGSVFAEETLDAITVPLGNGNVLGSIEKPLGAIKSASKLTVSITIVGTEVSNQWDFWVYPDFGDATPGDVVILRRFGKELFDALQKGERVLLLPRREEIREPLDGRFIPVFWSPLHFPDQPGSLGAMIDADHPLFAEFPTSTHTDWQWWELLATSTSVNCDLLGGEFTPIMRFIDKYNRNSLPAILWETQVGGGKLLVCTLDIESRAQERIVAAQLKRSILAYMNSDRFSPEPVVDASQLARLFQVCPFRILLTKGTSHPDYPLSNLWDQKPETIWHTDWNESSNRHPYTVEIELDEPRDVAGLYYHPRPGSNPNGRIAEYRIDVSADGAVWNTVHTGTFPNDASPKEIRFRSPCVAARMRFIALSEVNGQPHCAIAELRPIPVDDAVDVEDFNPIEGFNTGRQGRQPNIVWIMAEDISTELSCYGHGQHDRRLGDDLGHCGRPTSRISRRPSPLGSTRRASRSHLCGT